MLHPRTLKCCDRWLALALSAAVWGAPVRAETVSRTAYGMFPEDVPSLDWAIQRYQPVALQSWHARSDERAVVAIVADNWPRQQYLERYRVVEALGRVAARHRYSLVMQTESGTVVGRYACADDLPDSPTLLKGKPTSQADRQSVSVSPCQLSLKIETPLVFPASG
ncbi:MAG: hypothetical protein AAFX40_04330 [Cyanobacteria bacterium J06639_1]